MLLFDVGVTFVPLVSVLGVVWSVLVCVGVVVCVVFTICVVDTAFERKKGKERKKRIRKQPFNVQVPSW